MNCLHARCNNHVYIIDCLQKMEIIFCRQTQKKTAVKNTLRLGEHLPLFLLTLTWKNFVEYSRSILVPSPTLTWNTRKEKERNTLMGCSEQDITLFVLVTMLRKNVISISEQGNKSLFILFQINNWHGRHYISGIRNPHNIFAVWNS